MQEQDKMVWFAKPAPILTARFAQLIKQFVRPAMMAIERMEILVRFVMLLNVNNALLIKLNAKNATLLLIFKLIKTNVLKIAIQDLGQMVPEFARNVPLLIVQTVLQIKRNALNAKIL